MEWVFQDATVGSMLLGKISYGELSAGSKGGKANGGPPCPAKSTISYMVPPAAKVCHIYCFCLILTNLTLNMAACLHYACNEE
jgi:hypothetical protein